MYWKMSLGSKGEGQTQAVELKSISICLEQGTTAVFNIINIFILSNEQYGIVCWNMLACSIVSIRNSYVYITLNDWGYIV